MVENVEKLLNREEKLTLIAHKANNFVNMSNNIYYKSAQVRKMERNKQIKMMLLGGGGIIV